ncbi:MAG: DUF4249 family protein [Cyclobacteriaceae bacterium]|nr:DUF4249 family protein [Cyclobacteriaceae bacterium]
MKRSVWLPLAFIGACLGCERPLNIPIKANVTGKIAVEATITNENRSQMVRLYQPHAALNEPDLPASGADVTIMINNTELPLTEFPVGSGYYHSAPFRALFGNTYTLIIKWHDKVYVGTDSPQPVEPLQSINVSSAGDGYILNQSNSGQLANFIENRISWANTSACTSGNCFETVIFYDLKNIDVNEVFKPGKSVETFPSGSYIIRRKHSVSEIYKSYLRAMLSETEWRGGYFDVQRDNATSNMSGGCLGFFATTTVVSDTIIVK